MKTKQRLVITCSLLLFTFSLLLVTCKNPAGGTDGAGTYTGTLNGITYTLLVSPGRIRAAHAVGENYKLTVARNDGTEEKISAGKLSSVVDNMVSNSLTLQPDYSNTPTYLAVVSDTRLLSLTGLITFSDGTTMQGPGSFIASNGGGGGGGLSIQTYTVVYDANGGNGTMDDSSFTIGVLQALDQNTFTLAGHGFMGWALSDTGPVEFADQEDVLNLTTTGGNTVTLYAVWTVITVPPGTTLNERLNWLSTNALSNVSYTLDVSADENIAPRTLSYSGRTNVTITLRGTDAMYTIGLLSQGTLFSIWNGVTLVLDNNITLQGLGSNNNALVQISSGGSLVMNTGSRITGNTFSGAFDNAGGVRMWGGTFTMNGGEISGNRNTNTAYVQGGGVYVSAGIFNMIDGTISGNNASWGGGVGVSYSGVFNMSGGTITGNTAVQRGGGVSITWGGSFDKTDGTITGSNTAGGNRAFDGTLSGNAVDASTEGGSVNNKRKETTAGPTVNLTYNGSVTPPTWSGGWDF